VKNKERLMHTLVLKLIVTPVLIGGASLAGRRWGPGVSGWLVGLPFTSGPIAFFLALDHGLAFAAAAAVGTLTGTISQAAFALSYAWLSLRYRWPLAMVGSCAAFAAATAALEYLALPLPLIFLLVLAVLAATLRLLPRVTHASVVGTPARWDIPVRMVVATAFVLALTGVAPVLGSRLSGLLTPFPLYATILAVFAHRLQGPAAATSVLRGLLFGLFAFTTFFLVLAALIEGVGLGAAFAASMSAALVIQAAALGLLRRKMGNGVSPRPPAS